MSEWSDPSSPHADSAGDPVESLAYWKQRAEMAESQCSDRTAQFDEMASWLADILGLERIDVNHMVSRRINRRKAGGGD